MNFIKKNSFVLTIIFVFLFFLFDLGNLNAIRQGTEGFYLQISREMFENNSFLTPTYMDSNHWSKPPFHFWLSQPFYFLAGGSNLLSARLSILLLSIITILFIAKWVKRHFLVSSTTTFIFFFSTIGIIKYSRIYMMEAPLSLISVLSSLIFYDYLYRRKLKYLILASLLLGLSILIKGPVSFVMVIGSLTLYALFTHFSQKENHIFDLLLFSAFSLCIGSIWFFISYLEYGQEFFEYFFIRENLGKFTAKSYPIRHVFQGLLIFSFPWSLYLFSIISKSFKGHLKPILKISQNTPPKYYFIAILFAFNFFLWLIPSQRSHHYAVPALPYFLILLLVLIKQFNDVNFGKYTKRAIGIIYLTLGFILLFVFRFKEFTLSDVNILLFLIGLSICIFSSICFLKNKNINLLLFLSFLTTTYIWIILTPLFHLPKVPGEISEYLRDKDVAAFVHKPYFLEEAIGKKFTNVSPDKLRQYIIDHPNKVYFVSQSIYKAYKLHDVTNIHKSWPIWLRGRRVTHILNAISRGNLKDLKEESYILLPKIKK